AMVGLATSDDYDPLIRVLKNLSPEEQAELVRRVQSEVKCASIDALERFIFAKGRSALIHIVKSIVSDFN
ncbi:unnamed protein product, partial [Candidula unifasciata]